MDPFVIFLITMIALGGGSAGGAVALVRRRQQREAIQAAILDKVDHHGRPLSVFDVFWDLGVSEYALSLMDHHGLLLDRPADFERVHHRLDDLIEAHGTYTDFIEDNLEAIQEFYREHRQTGHRRKIPTMTLRQKKLLPVAQKTPDAQPSESTELARRQESSPADASAPSRPKTPEESMAEHDLERDLGRIVQDSVEERRHLREEGSPTTMTTRPDEQAPEAQRSGERGVDVDDLVRLEPLQMVKNIFDGRLTDEVRKLWKFRHLRSAKSRLDDHFEAFYDFYAELAHERPNFMAMLYDTARRWNLEAARIEELEQRKPWTGEPFSDCAQALVEQAAQLARQLSSQARHNVDTTVERIHQFAREDDRAMAGYLLYLNHHAFFAGRAPGYLEYVQRIERQAYRVQEELRQLRREGEL